MSQSFTRYVRLLAVLALSLVCTLRSEAITLSTSDLTHEMGKNSPGVFTSAGLRTATLGVWSNVAPDSKFVGITISGAVTDVKCYGANTGRILLTVSGGVAPYTYVWSNAATTQNLLNVKAGTYTVTVKDAQQTTSFKQFTVGQPTEIIAYITCNGVCYGLCNGTADVTASGGVAPYTYAWSGPGGYTAGNVTAVTGLCLGTYWVTVKDANGCIKIVGGTVCSNPKINIAGTPSNVTCYGLCNGSVSVTITRGNDANTCTSSKPCPVTLSWKGPGSYTAGNVTSLSNLCPGKYVVTAIDCKGCSAKDSFLITQPDSLKITTSHTDLVCNGVCIGTATVTVSGGTPNYTINWSNSDSHAFSREGLCAGTYCFTVTDAHNCPKTGCIVITQPNTLTVDITADVNCMTLSDSTASLTAVANGGTVPYSYAWSGPNGFTATGNPILINEPGATYYVTVTDANGCKDVDSAKTQTCVCPPGIISLRDTSVCANNVSVTLTPSIVAGTPQAYFWSNGATTASINVTTSGTYSVTVTFLTPDCVTADTAVVGLYPQPVVTEDSSNVTCFDLCNGSVTLTVTQVGNDYTTSWIGPNGYQSANQNSIGELCPGTYCYTVTSSNGCSVTGCASITEPTELNVEPSQTNVTCYGACNGTVDLSISGGTPEYTIAWDKAGLSGAHLTELCEGTYCFTVTDANGCSTSGCASIDQPDSLSVIGFPSDVTCYGACNGGALVLASGGTPDPLAEGGYTIVWDDANVSGYLVFDLCPGTYCFTITDANGCTKSSCVTIAQPDSLTIETRNSPVTCYGACNGSAAVSVSGGTPGDDPEYIIEWDNVAASGFNPTELCAGTYCFTVTDANFCTKGGCITITQPDSLSVESFYNPVTCYGSCDGALMVTVSGGTPDYTINWNKDIPGFEVENLCAGTYCFTVTDANGCSKVGCIEITQPDSLHTSYEHTNVTCYGACNGTITVSVSGGSDGGVDGNPYKIKWDKDYAGFNLTGLCAGTYCYTVSDANGCTKTNCVTITQPDSLTVTADSVDVTCYGSCNGSATVTVSGGTAEYTINWNKDVAGFNPEGLCAGTYCFTVTDANGCSKVGCVTVNQPDSLSVIGFPSDVTCYGACNGGALVLASGGTPDPLAEGGYTIVWDDANVSGYLVFDLCPGTYCFTITDANGCTKSSCVTIAQPDSLTIETRNSPVTCYGACNGSAAVSVSGGTPGDDPEYIIEWDNVAASGFNPTELCVGTYCFTVTDANFCTKGGCITITQPDSLSVTDSHNNVTCYGSCNGSVSVTVSGGTPSYSITWANSASISFTREGLCAGTYTYTVTDANGCSKAGSETVTQPDSLTVTDSHNNVTCYGSCNGSVSVTVSGGTPSYSITWANSASISFTREGLCAGTYTYTVTDANGCSKAGSETVTQPDSLTVTDSHNNVTCYGSCNGSVSVTVSGGTPSYSITWANSASISFTREGLCAGTYTYTVTDANGCSKAGSETVTQPDSLHVTNSHNNPTCYGSCNGNATVTVSGGTPGYSITWAQSASTSFTRFELCVGTYCYTVTDANGCSKVGCVTLTQPDSLTVTDRHTNVTCYSACNGTVSVSVSGGTPSYSITWANSASISFTREGLCAGTYCYTVTDANGCSKVGCETVTQPDSLKVTTDHNNVSCYASCNGSASVSVSGGTPSYSITWANSAAISFTREGLCAGTYCFTVNDANGCTKGGCITITQPDSLVVVVDAEGPRCYGECNGTINVDVTGGTTDGVDGGYTIKWNKEGLTGFDLDELCAGTYCFTVTDANGCSKFDCVTIGQPDSLDIDVTHTDLTCNQINGLCDGTIAVTVTGGTKPYTIAWSDNLFGFDGFSIENLCPDTYCFTVTDANGCTKAGCVTITEPPVLLIASNCCPDQITCHNECSGKIKITVFGGVPPFTYSWSGPNGYTSADSNIFHLCPGVYTLTITDANGCTYDHTHAPIINPDSIIANITGVNPSNCVEPCDGSASVAPTGGNAPYTILWNNGSTDASITGLCAGKYKVTITDELGCSVVDSVVLTNINCTCPTVTEEHTNLTCYNVCTGTITLSVGNPAPANYTVTWNNGKTGTSLTALCAGTYCYTFVSTTPNCTTTGCVTISQPTQVTVTDTHTNLTCNGVCNGTVTVTPAGGTPEYTITWAQSASTSFKRGDLCAGTYCYTVTDANGCSAFGCETVEQPTVLTVEDSHTDATCSSTTVECKGFRTQSKGGWHTDCNGGNPGCYRDAHFASCFPNGLTFGCAGGTLTTLTTSAQVASFVAGGNTLGKQLVAAILSNTFDQCDPNFGSSNLNLKDLVYTGSGTLNGKTVQFIIDEANKVVGGCASAYTSGNLNTVLDNLNNNYDGGTQDLGYFACTTGGSTTSACNGTITVSPAGGTGSKTIVWDKDGVSGFTPTGLCAGTYCYTVTDANGCKAYGCETVGQSSSLDVTAAKTDVTCHGNCNGTATLTINGGTPSYTITWSDNASIHTTTRTGLCAGTYCFTVTDVNKCSGTGCVTITAPDQLVIDATGTNPTSCVTNCNGTATVSITGGTEAYSIVWSTSATTTSISGLCAGKYKVTVYDANQCSAVDSVTLLSTNCECPVVTNTHSDVTCYNACNGTITVTPAAQSPTTIVWDKQGVTGFAPTGLCAGTYCYTVTYTQLGCTQTACVTIGQPTAVTVETSSTPASCNGVCNGSATVTVNGGTPNYTINWANSNSHDFTRTGLCGGTYCFTVTDAHGCPKTGCVTVSQNSLTVTEVHSNLSCKSTCGGSCDGSITLTVTSSADYTINWANSSLHTATRTGLCAGTYCYTVTSGNCTATGCVTLSKPTDLTITVTGTNATCSASCSGTATVTVNTGDGPYTYKWSNNKTTKSLTELCPGTYCVTVTSALGCTASKCVCITGGTPISISVCSSDLTCNGNCNGTASVTATGGSGYKYIWNNGKTTSSINCLCAGTYCVTVTSASGCSAYKCVTVKAAPGITITTSSTNINCNGSCNGTASVSVTSGSGPFSYKWSNGKYTSSINCLCAGKYYVTVTNCNGCSATACVTISEPTPICVNLTTKNTACSGSCTGTACASASGGNGTFTYKWSNGKTTSTVSNLCAGSYSVTVTSGGCCVVKCFTICQPSSTVKICVSGKDVKYGNDGSACVTSVSGGTAPYTYAWSCSKTTSCIYNLKAGTYSVTVYDANHCSATACVTIKNYCGARIDGEDEGTSVSITVDEPKVNVYPNPFTTYANITFVTPKDDNVVLEVFSVTGAKVAQLFKGDVKGGIENTAVFTSSDYNVSEGMYIYRLVTANKTVTGNLIIVH